MPLISFANRKIGIYTLPPEAAACYIEEVVEGSASHTNNTTKEFS
jgi:hypothetical protein